MIKRIKRKNIDLEKYSRCLAESVNYMIYAEFWYLDVLTNQQWDCFVLNDYEAIMPLPFQKKFGLKIILQPIYCQQLGVFHSNNFSSEMFESFIKKLKFNIVRSYHFNESNTVMFDPKGEKRINQILDLDDSVTKNYDKKTSKNCKSYRNKQIEILDNCSIEDVIRFKEMSSAHQVNIQLLTKLLRTLAEHKSINIKFAWKEEFLGFACFVQSKNRTIYINSAVSAKGKKSAVATGLLNNVIETNLDKKLILDFEGSSIPSISNFFGGFGAKTVYYTKFKHLWI